MKHYHFNSEYGSGKVSNHFPILYLKRNTNFLLINNLECVWRCNQLAKSNFHFYIFSLAFRVLFHCYYNKNVIVLLQLLGNEL